LSLKAADGFQHPGLVPAQFFGQFGVRRRRLAQVAAQQINQAFFVGRQVQQFFYLKRQEIFSDPQLVKSSTKDRLAASRVKEASKIRATYPETAHPSSAQGLDRPP
jgi:hypothetical protein